MKVLRNHSIKYRIIAAFLLLSIVPLLLSNFFFYHAYAQSFLQKFEHSTKETITLLRRNVKMEMEKYEYFIGSVCTSSEMQSALADFNNKEAADYTVVMQAIEGMKDMAYPPYVKNVRVLDMQHRVLYDLGYDDLPNEQLQSLLQDCNAKAPYDSWRYVQSFRQQPLLICTRKIYDRYILDKQLGYALMFVDERLFSRNLLRDINFGEGSTLALISSAGTVLASQERQFTLGENYPDDQLLQLLEENKHITSTVLFTHGSGGGQKIVCAVPIENMDALVVTTIPYSYLYSEMSLIRNVVIIASSSLIFVCALIMVALYRSLIFPVQKIKDYCELSPSDQLSERIVDSSSDEIGILARSINQMVDRIASLLEQQSADQKRKRRLELQMLQYQINPHFLFNSLNTLKWVAMINKVPAVSNGIAALSGLLKSTIVNKDEYIPLKDEIKNLQNYFEIQKLRYADFFTAQYELDERLLENPVPKFILQPLAENSILHGIDGSPIILTLRCYSKDKCIIIEIEDNGKGFDCSAHKNQAAEKMTGIGVSNVAERIKLSFGAEYGLDLQSEPGHGTLCRLFMPLCIPEKEEDKNV